ncbi:MAG: DUF4292 domain-containing protein [Chitinophagaceae bacterium]|nr:DUF4292 domain-containing protein [Chitinophagaceae bacterium]
MPKGTWIIFLIMILALYACRSTKKIQSAIIKKDTVAVPIAVVDRSKEDSVLFIQKHYDSILQNKINYTTFSGKVDVEYRDGDGKKYDVNAVIRMYKDSVIWVSVTAILGIEGLRAYITRDSVKLLNKQDKVYTARSVSYLQEVTALPLNLSTLQDLLVGNPVFLEPRIVSYSTSPGTISLLSLGDFFKNLFTISSENKLTISSKLDDVEEMRNRTCYLSYEEYETKKGPNFSTRRSINVSEKKQLDIKLNYRQYEFNETLSFPFNVPKSYSRN